MKKHLLVVCTFFVALLCAYTSFATGNPNSRTKSNSYFQFSYNSAVRHADNTVTLTFEVKNFSKKGLSYVAFELPDGASIISPATKYKGAYTYHVYNGTNNPFQCVKFRGQNTRSYMSGKSEKFVYTISGADFDKLKSIRVKANCDDYEGKVIFDPKECDYQEENPTPEVNCEVGAATPTNIRYEIDGVSYTVLKGNVKPGKKVKVCFTTATSSTPSTFSLVSYKAPSASFNEQTANQQEVYDSKTISTKGGEICMEVNVPNCFFQVDFVKGCVIEKLGPANTSNFYGKQGRLLADATGGSVSCIDVMPPVECEKADKCFDFSYKGYVLNKDGKTVTLTFGIKTNCDRDLSYAAFELPSKTSVISYSKGQFKYKTSYTKNPFNSIKFEGVGIRGYKNGVSDEFKYVIKKSDFDKMTTIRVQAKASTTVGTVTFDAKGCNNVTEQPTCIAPEIELIGDEDVSYSNNKPVNFSVDVLKGSDLTFKWDVPSDWEIISGQNTAMIQVKIGRKKGSVSVTAKSECGEDTETLTVTPVKCNDDGDDNSDKDYDHDNDKDKDDLYCVVSPNPVNNGQCVIDLDGKEGGQIQIVHYLTGRQVCIKNYSKGTRRMTLNTKSLNIKSGIYIVVCKQGRKETRTRLVVND